MVILDLENLYTLQLCMPLTIFTSLSMLCFLTIMNLPKSFNMRIGIVSSHCLPKLWADFLNLIHRTQCHFARPVEISCIVLG